MIPTVQLVDENTTHPKIRAIFDDIKATKKIMGTSPSSDTYNEIGVGIPLINGTAAARLCQADDLIFCVRGSTTGASRYCR